MADSGEGTAGTTKVPEFKLPDEMQSLHNLRSLHKAMEDLTRLRHQQIQRGKAQKAANQQTLDALKEKNVILKKKINEQKVAQEKADNSSKGKRNIGKELGIKRRKLDEMKAKTALKKQQLSAAESRF